MKLRPGAHKPAAMTTNSDLCCWSWLGLPAQTYDNVNARDLEAFRRGWRFANEHFGVGDIQQLILAFPKKIMMRLYIGVEICLSSIDCDLSQQANLGELVQRVVNRGQRHRHFRAGGFFVKHLSSKMAIALAEQDPAQGHALTGRAQPDLPQHSFDVVPRTAGQRRPVW